MKNIYYISECIPFPGYGSFIIFYRHLARLEKEGYSINLIVPQYERSAADKFLDEIKSRWNVIMVPFKKWWFLFPYRHDSKLLRNTRYWFVSLYLRKQFKTHPPDFVITYFYNQFFNGLATFVKNDYQCRLGIFLHDDKYLLNKIDSPTLLEYDQYLSEQADVIWTVSEDLFIPGTDKAKYHLLYPIPSGDNNKVAKWADAYTKPVIGFSGMIFHEYESVFRQLAASLTIYGGKLVMVINNSPFYKWLPALLEEFSNITLVESFPDVKDTMSFLTENCTALFCGYPDCLDGMPWIKTCFPSKFIEFSHLGMPIILTSPEGTALAKWAVKHNWRLFSPTYDSPGFEKLFQDITNEHGWNTNAQQALMVSKTIFDAENIHQQLLTDIERYA